jgi:hypothetical protein
VLFWRLDPTSGHDDPRLSDPVRQFVLLCADGYSSSLAAATLQDLGFGRATDVIGGFTAWAAAGLPLEPAPDRPDGRRQRPSHGHRRGSQWGDERPGHPE